MTLFGPLFTLIATLLLWLCVQVDPATRLGSTRKGAESVRVHPFFWGLSWEELEHRQLPTVSVPAFLNRE